MASRGRCGHVSEPRGETTAVSPAPGYTAGALCSVLPGAQHLLPPRAPDEPTSDFRQLHALRTQIPRQRGLNPVHRQAGTVRGGE